MCALACYPNNQEPQRERNRQQGNLWRPSGWSTGVYDSQEMICEHDNLGGFIRMIQCDPPMRLRILVGPDRTRE
jgi:hypothetical protein